MSDPASLSHPKIRMPLQYGALLSLAAALIWPLQAFVIAYVLSGLLAGDSAVSPVWSGLAYLALGLVRAWIENASQQVLAKSASQFLNDTRLEMLETEARDIDVSGTSGAGALAALMAEKLETLRPFITRYQPARMRVMVLPLLILVIAVWNSWAVCLVLLMAGPLIPLFMALIGWAARDASERQMGEIGQLSDLLADRLAALPDLQLIGAGKPVIDSFATASGSLRERTMAVLRIAFLSSTVLELFSALGVAMVAVWVGFALLGEISWGTWNTPLTPLIGIYLLLLTPEFFQPLRDLAAAWHDKASADAVLAEIEAWRQEQRTRFLGNGRQPDKDAARHAISLRAVSVQRGSSLVTYPDLNIAAGDSLAITGPSGVGKSSLLRLLAGLDRPASGDVLIDAVPLTDDTADMWRAHIGWMPQAPHFLNRSLRYNIGFGAPLRPEILDQSGLGSVINALPNGDLTPLGERGAGISGGEARRVMLARALHGGPDILLADEPTADLDAATADVVMDGLLGFAAEGGTLVVATHDPRLVSRMARVLPLDPQIGGRE